MQKEIVRPPGPSTTQVLLRIPVYGSNYIRAQYWVRTFAKLPYLKFGSRHVYYYFSPDYAQRAIKDNAKYYVKSWFYNELRPLLGESLLLTEGEKWRAQRRTIAPVFHSKHFESYFKLMHTTTLGLIKSWEQKGVPGTSVDVEPEMLSLAFQIATKSFFGDDLKEEIEDIGDKFIRCLAHANGRMQLPFNLPRSFPSPGNLLEKRARKSLEDTVNGIIDRRRKEKGLQEREDILSRLICATDPESNHRMTNQEVYDQVVTFLVAGHDTTSSALTWGLYSIAKHPEIQKRIFEEINQALGDSELTLEKVGKLPYLKRVIQESLRLYPPAPAFSRDLLEDDELAGYKIPKGSVAVINVYLLHHDPENWENPEAFDPDRFLPERSAKRHPFAYIPFSAGPRACVGEHFAMLELQVIFANLVRQFEFSLAPGFNPKMRPSITLRTKAGMKLVPRSRKQ